MKRIAEIIVIVLAAAFPSASIAGKQEGKPDAAGTVTGRVERVIDPPQALTSEGVEASRRAGGDNTYCFTGTVVRVIDGDTIIVGTNRVRLAEIDAPEMKTPHGPASKAALSAMILHKEVTVTWTRRGRYRRIIGQVYLDDEWVNLSMVAQGWARQFKRYSRSEQMAAAEAKARKKARWIWPSLIAP